MTRTTMTPSSGRKEAEQLERKGHGERGQGRRSHSRPRFGGSAAALRRGAVVPRAQASSAETGAEVLARDRDHLDHLTEQDDLDHLTEQDDQDQHGRHDHRGVHDGGGLEGGTGMIVL